jgi:hypothetical protein
VAVVAAAHQQLRRAAPGAVEDDDRAEAALAARVTRPPHHLGRALALAAIRETFEETGLMIGTRAYGPPDAAPDGPWAASGGP